VCSITTTLKLGSKGTEVKCLQINLNLKVDGAFGKATKIALLAWQKKEGLTADGVFGNKSREVWGKQD
jgi:peptidoglycan hydrolase-like protein with peptidoglycan-binding domain